MNIDQLMESLSGNAPEPDHVLASLRGKRRAARNRMYAASGGLAVAVVATVAGVLLHGASTSTGTSAQSGRVSGPSAPVAAPAEGSGTQLGGTGSNSANASTAAGCDSVRFQAKLAEAVRQGASVIVGYGTLAAGPGTVLGASGHATAYYSLTLRSVQTLAGPTVAQGSVAWIAATSPAASASSGTAQQRTDAPAGELFGIVSPAAASGAPGQVLQAAPVVNGQVLLAGPGCWDITASGSPQQPDLHQSTNAAPLGGVPIEIPLATAEKLAAASR